MLEFKEDQVYKCVHSVVKKSFTVGNCYPVRVHHTGDLVIYSDRGGAHSEEFLNSTKMVKFELVEKENDEVIKKCDIVKVISKDHSCGLDYEVNTTWAVTADVGGRLFVKVFDYRQPDNEGLLCLSHVKKLNLDLELDMNEPKPDPNADVKPVFINVENLMEHIVTNKLEVNEILSYLGGYVEGSRF